MSRDTAKKFGVILTVFCLLASAAKPDGFGSLCSAAPAPQGEQKGLANEFFAMDTGTIDANHITAQSQVAMLKELGYAGLAYWDGNPKRGKYDLKDVLTELDKAGLKLYPLYVGVWLDEGKPKYEEGLPEAIKLLKGRNTGIWLHIMSEKFGKSSPPRLLGEDKSEGDERAVQIIREVADMAHEAGAWVALYPHVNEWLERHDDALRVAKKVNRRNVGVSFNLFHRLRVEGEVGIDQQLEQLKPYLFTVTINGSAKTGSIETLDKGDFDVYGLLKKLDKLGYKGPIGLQGWGIEGDVHENLKRSMEAWKGFNRRLHAPASPDASRGGGAQDKSQ
jgi:sugar phosphate isomerase/epimerase